MLWLDADALEDLEFDTEITLQDVKDLLSMLLLGLGKTNFILVICIFRLSVTNLIVFKNSINFFPHELL
jgi:hypothetical protein